MTVQRTQDRETPEPNEIIVTARRRYGALLLVDADIDGQAMIVILDTGASGTIGNLALKGRLEKRRRDPVPVRTVMMLDVAGNIIQAQAAQLPTIRLGGLRMRGTPAAFADVETFRQFGLIDRPAMLLGMDVLRLFKRVAIDFGAKKVRFLLE
jgi:predicted aspartyl protease